MKRIALFCSAFILTATLYGCGGGSSCGASALLAGISTCAGNNNNSSSSPQTVVQSAVEGLYQGTTSAGKTEYALVLEDGSFWGIYGTSVGSALAVEGVATGSASANNGTFTLTFTDFYAPGNAPVTGQGSGAYTASSLVGTITENGGTTTFNFIAPVQTTYDYNSAATLSSIAGSWTGDLLTGETSTITISATGGITGTSSLGCAITGTAVPRASGKNVFDVTLTFGAAPCVAANQTVSGIGLTYPLGNGKTQLVAGVVNPSKTLATAFFAQR